MEKEKKLRRLIAGAVVICLIAGSGIGYQVIAAGNGEKETADVEDMETVNENSGSISNVTYAVTVSIDNTEGQRKRSAEIVSKVK